MVLLNVGSLFLGIIALAFPIINIVKRDRYGVRRKRLSTFLSFVSCLGSIYFQFLANYYLVRIEDISTLMDIMGSSVVISGLLIFATIVLNFITLKLDDN